MLLNSTHRLLVVLPLLGVVFAWSCGKPAGHQGFLVAPTPQQCPNFALRDSTFGIRVTSAGDSVDLGGGNFLRFPAGAIADSAQYQITYAPKLNNARVAGIELDSVSGPMQFSKAVTVHLSYQGCPELGTGQIVIMQKQRGKPAVSIGGANLPEEKAIEALIGHFTEYAIAM